MITSSTTQPHKTALQAVSMPIAENASWRNRLIDCLTRSGKLQKRLSGALNGIPCPFLPITAVSIHNYQLSMLFSADMHSGLCSERVFRAHKAMLMAYPAKNSAAGMSAPWGRRCPSSQPVAPGSNVLVEVKREKIPFFPFSLHTKTGPYLAEICKVEIFCGMKWNKKFDLADFRQIWHTAVLLPYSLSPVDHLALESYSCPSAFPAALVSQRAGTVPGAEQVTRSRLDTCPVSSAPAGLLFFQSLVPESEVPHA